MQAPTGTFFSFSHPHLFVLAHRLLLPNLGNSAAGPLHWDGTWEKRGAKWSRDSSAIKWAVARSYTFALYILEPSWGSTAGLHRHPTLLPPIPLILLQYAISDPTLIVFSLRCMVELQSARQRPRWQTPQQERQLRQIEIARGSW